MSQLNCNELISNLVNRGGKIILDKSEGGPGLRGRMVHITLDECEFKIGYMDLGQKEIVVQQTCNCHYNYDCPNAGEWKNIPNNCLKIAKKAI
jgi:hypothetical protein